MFNRRKGPSLEDAIRSVQQKYRNRPSPLQYMQENTNYIPTHVPQNMKPSANLRDNLLSGFKPHKDTFR
jgi:hypothetical protein